MKEAKKKKSKSKPKDIKDLAKSEYTDEQKARIVNFVERSDNGPLKFKKVKGVSSKPTMEIQEADGILAVVKMLDAFGTPDSQLQNFLLNQAVQTFRGCVASEGFDYERMAEFCNNAMAILNGIHPRDEIEGMLAVQMVGVHNLAMETLKRAMITDQTFEGKQANINEATKMLRTFIAQMEALKKYRSGGHQKVTVEHVHVNEGGQAIVGNVSQGGRGE